MPCNDGKRVNRNQDFMAPIECMKMGRMVVIEKHLDDDAIERLISGMRLLESGEQLFRRLTGEAKVDGIWAEIEVVTPEQLSAVANPCLLKDARVIPCRKDPLADEVRKIHLSFHTVFVLDP